ncbi:UDP-glucuronosyltransferase-like [Lampris incognitus]|uniref:UDP-glucuronosyltransferase-like n=1 Tax=Lampris incognitus TaxID=2546036 RepID=UPI0024B49C4C|nr:UDP-glucuronosyltransferase-like [Lampris incognitus]
MAGGTWVSVLWLQAWLCCLTPGPVDGGKVLVMPVDGSHWLSMKLLVKELTLRGHEVVVLVPETSLLIQGSDGFRTEVFQVPFTKAELDQTFNTLRDGVFTRTPVITTIFVDVGRLMNFTSLQVRGCESLLHNQKFTSRLRDERFDLMLTDPFLPCGTILADSFSIPAVYFLRGIPCGLDLQAAQCPSPPSYVPRYASGNTDHMNFPQRVKNMVLKMVESILCRVLFASFDELASRYLGKDVTYKDLLGHGAIWLLRYDFAFEWPKPLMPNMVLIGGINCVRGGSLPADLEEFVDGSGDDGFVVFTLGSLVSSMPREKAKQFFDAFRQIPQRVVWRYTGVVPEDVPKNVRIMKWLPQNELLAHPKAKAFITHGGTHGIYEGICNGVPMVMMPLFGDQPDNMHHMVARGVAVKLNVFDVTTAELLDALNKVINDKSYKEKMVKLSEVHNDRPIEPLDLAVFWTEFVIRHKGAEHLRTAAHDLNWIQYHSLDVFSLLIVILTLVILVTLKCCLFFTHNCCGKVMAKRKRE